MSVEWKIGMRCWSQYCGPDRQHTLKLCEITELSHWNDNDGKAHKFAELRYVNPFYDCEQRMEMTSEPLEILDRNWEIKMAEIREIAETIVHNTKLEYPET